MLCPLAKGMLAMAGAANIDADILAKQAQCNGSECGLWDLVGQQCSIVSIAIELRNIRKYGTEARD